MEFDVLARRWIGLIMKAAQEYQIPGRLDFDDCVQEALLALHDVHQRSIGTPFDPDVNPEVFEKWVKTAIFHRLVDVKRRERADLRDYTKDLSPLPIQDAEGEFVDFFASMSSKDDPTDNVIEADEIVETLTDRLSTCTSCTGICKCGKDHRLVLRLLTDPTPELLEFCRNQSVTRRVIKKEGKPDQVIESESAITRVKQVHLQAYLGWTKQQVGDAVWQIRQRIKDFRPTTPVRWMSQLFYFLGFTDGEEEGFKFGLKLGVSLTYDLLLNVMAEDEQRIMSLLSTPGIDKSMSLADLSIYLGMSDSRLRDAMSRMRIRIEYATSGAPLDQVAKLFKEAA